MSYSCKRRDFLKLSACGILASGAALHLGGCNDSETLQQPSRSAAFGLTSNPSINFTQDCEVLIIGSGIAGLSAAIEPLKAKRKVLVVDKLDLLGGESFASNGVFLVAGTEIQKKAGFASDIDKTWESYRSQLPQDLDPLALSFQEKLFKNQCNWINLLVNEMGSEFADPSTYLDKDDPRGILLPKLGIGDMESVMVPLKDKLVDLGLTTTLDLAAAAFITDQDGIASGVRFHSLKTNELIDISAQKIVVATGGFISNQQMVQKNLPDWVNARCQTSASMGEGQNLCRQINGKISGLNYPINLISDIPTVSDWGSFAPVICLTPKGNRFAAEDDRFAAANKCYAEYMGFWWSIFDKQLMESKQTPNVAKTLEKNKKRVFESCETLEDLAEKINVPFENLKKSFDEYEQAIKNSKEDPVGRTRFLKNLEPPYTAIKLFPSRYTSYGGASVDETGHVLNNLGQAIKNVFCCGSCMDGCYSGLASAGTFGWMVGQQITEELNEELPIDTKGRSVKKSTEDPDALDNVKDALSGALDGK